MPTPVYPLALKPDLAEAARRYEAYYAGELIDRPLVHVTAPRDPGFSDWYYPTYRDHVFGDMGETLDRSLETASHTYFGGEAVPAFYPSLAPDIAAVYCGAELKWSEDSGNTNWSVPCVDDWETALPLRLNTEHPLWQRQMAYYRLAAEKLEGKMLLRGIDWHTNLDLLSGLRGPARLCLDCAERPDLVDAAMQSARAIFPELWKAITEAGRMEERGHCNLLYSMDGADILQSDFGAMLSPAMFQRWAIPALEEEATYAKHVYYHWDGPTQLVHEDLICATRGLHTIQYQMGAGRGNPIDYLELYQRLQAKGKAIHFWGSVEDLKAAHRVLNPARVYYQTSVGSVKEAEELLAWFVRNT